MTRSSNGAGRSGPLDRVVRLLEAFQDGRPLGAAELAAAVGSHRSTAFRIAQSLVAYGWLQQDPDTRKYRPGIRLWELSSIAVADVDICQAARPHMRKLAAVSGESSDLAILDGADVVYIEHIAGSRAVRVFSRIGMRVPAHAVAMGKVLLAYLPEDECRARLGSGRLKTFTPRTVARQAELERQLEQIRRDGYAVNVGEWRADAGGLAAPVFDRNDECAAAVSIDLPASRIDPETIRELTPMIRSAAAAISREAGSRGAVR